MKKNKMHKLDFVFIVGIGIIALLSALIDVFYMKEVNFPVRSCISIYYSYILLIILLIYSSIKYKEKQEKLEYIRWYMFFCLPFLHIAFIVVGFIVGNLLINFFNF